MRTTIAALFLLLPLSACVPAPSGVAPAVPGVPPAASKPNTSINDNLNAADQMFKAGMDGCANVTMAITSANSPAVFGAPTEEQKASLRAYAARCNLRY
jgi:hypothetical protein